MPILWVKVCMMFPSYLSSVYLYMLCILENTLAVYHLLCWIKSLVLWSCASGTLGRITGFQGKWSAGWSGEVARSKVKRLCSERGGQHPDLEGTAVVKGWNWTAWILSLLFQSRSCSGLQPKSSQQLLSCCQPWPSNPKSLLHNTFSQHLWEMQISETIVPIQIMFCKGWKTEAQGWIIAT